jgi:arylsulfatase
MDLAPTFLKLGKTEYPKNESLNPILGESMVSLLEGESIHVHRDDYVTTLFHAGYAYVRQGKWKLVNLEPPFDESVMDLIDLETDPGETTDLAKDNSDQHQHMLNLCRTERKKLGIILPQDL